MLQLRSFVIAFALVGTACASDATSEPSVDGGSDAGPRSTGPGDWAAGDYPEGLSTQTYLEIADVPGQMGNVRQFKVHVPPSYDAEKPTPLVFCFHGLMQNAVMFCVNGAGMVEKADKEGFILVMPNGFENSWNGGTCCGGAASDKLDDVALVRAIFEEVGTHLNVDLDRVFATGLSNGGYLSYRLACEASDIFAAVAPGAGAIGMDDIGGGTSASGDFTECNPSHEVSVLDMHGTSDGLVAYKLQQPSLDRIALANGCEPTTEPAAEPASAGDTTCVTYQGCPSGIDVTGCTVMSGGHVWFGDETCGTGAGPGACSFVGNNSDTLVNTDAAWEFFRTHAR
jgi:polyhydroxybutyrate depolymerase